MSLLVVLVASNLAFSLGVSIHPEKGDKIPNFAKTFPGCGCVWMEPESVWSCEGTILWPEELQGDTCGCCGLGCGSSNRKSDDECLAGGYDQAAEMAALRQAAAKANLANSNTGESCDGRPIQGRYKALLKTNIDGGISDKYCYGCGKGWRDFTSKDCSIELACKEQCVKLGEKCTGFIIVGGGKCYFRQGTPVATGTDTSRDSYIKE